MDSGADPAPAPLRLILGATDDERAVVRDGLAAFNRAHTREEAERRGLETGMNPLDALLIDARGAVYGGLLGYTHWGWLHIQTLWVADAARGRGYGRALMQAGEREARRRGCVHSRLATYSFQARDFYERLGYTVWGRLDDYPPGHSSYAMRKDLR